MEHSINTFHNFKKIKKILVVYNKKHKKYIDKLKLNKTVKITGGRTRQESTYIALKKIRKNGYKKVLIHDAARPNTSKKLIKKITGNVYFIHIFLILKVKMCFTDQNIMVR